MNIHGNINCDPANKEEIAKIRDLENNPDFIRDFSGWCSKTISLDELNRKYELKGSVPIIVYFCGTNFRSKHGIK